MYRRLRRTLKNEPGVVFSTDYQYMCSESGQDIIKNAIADYKLTGVVICSGSPRMHEADFPPRGRESGTEPLYG